MKVQEYIAQHGTDKLTEEYGIIVKKYEDRMVLNYSQIESPKAHPITMECRGLILSLDGQNVISRAFDRFFNLGEAPDTQEHLDFSKAYCHEKVDGSLVKLYMDHDGLWELSTRGTAFAEAQTAFGISFKEIVYRALDCSSDQDFQDLCSGLDGDWTYIFEITSMENRIVKRYEGTTLHYLAARNNRNGEYGDDYEKQCALSLGAREIGVYTFDSPEACVEATKNLPDLEEGYVIWQDNRPVCKVKSPAYLAVHAIRGEGLTPKRAMSLVLMNEQDEYLSYFPEDKSFFVPYEEALSRLLLMIERCWEEHKDVEDQKEFALLVKDQPFSAVLFQARGKNQDPVHVFHGMREQQKMRLLSQEVDNA